jgi:pilus assembly protein Flp/PilA
MTRTIQRLMVGEDAATMVEYAMMLALIGAALITAVTAMSTSIGSKFTSVSTTLSGS